MLLFTLITYLTIYQITDAASCDYGWKAGVGEDNNHCYKVLADGFPVDIAYDNCASIGGSLAVFGSNAQYGNFTETIVPAIYNDIPQRICVLGFKRNLQTQTFFQIDGSPPNFDIPYGQGEPTGWYGAEDCLATGLGLFPKILDIGCDYPSDVICQQTLVKCPEGWMQGQMSDRYNCYKMVSNSTFTYKDALNECRKVNSYLPEFKTVYQFAEFSTMLSLPEFTTVRKGYAYLGYTRDVIFPQTPDVVIMKQINGQTVPFILPWAEGEPLKAGPDECTIIGYNGLVDDVRCGPNWAYFVCQFRADECYVGWTRGFGLDQHHCYKLAANRTDYTKAGNECETIGGKLPTFQNKNELTAFFNYTLPTVFLQYKTCDVFLNSTLVQQSWVKDAVGINSNACLVVGGKKGSSFGYSTCSNPGHNAVCQYDLGVLPPSQ